MTAPALAHLRAAGLRITPQRRTILAAIDAADHPTADEVYRRARRQLPELSRATVYNTLNELVRLGLLQTVEGAGSVRFDANLDRGHHHFRCRACESLFDVEVRGEAALALDAREGFSVEQTRIVFEGVCPDCRNENRLGKE